MKRLITDEEIKLAVSEIENSFVKTLRENGFDVAPNAACYIGFDKIELGISESDDKKNKRRLAFGSEISLYAPKDSKAFGGGFGNRKENEINFGTTGIFTPECKESYWRTIHAASILKNWVAACEIINSHCKMYQELEEEVRKQNPTP